MTQHAATTVRPAVPHHFHDEVQVHETATLGMWTFLATEVMFFGGLFTSYIVYRCLYPQTWVVGSHHLKEWAGAINTGVLLCSSLTMALAVRAAQLKDSRGIVRFVLLTIALGACFLGIKAVEYTLEYREHLVPGLNLVPHEFQLENKVPEGVANHLPLFMCFYFFMTVLHATHMVAGIGVMIYIVLAARRGKFNDNSNFVEMSGLYWHFVDIVWIFLFPLLYLIR